METIAFGKILEFRNHLDGVSERARLGTEGQHPARSWGLSTDRQKEPETPRAERALRTAPVRKEPPAARE